MKCKHVVVEGIFQICINPRFFYTGKCFACAKCHKVRNERFF